MPGSVVDDVLAALLRHPAALASAKRLGPCLLTLLSRHSASVRTRNLRPCRPTLTTDGTTSKVGALDVGGSLRPRQRPGRACGPAPAAGRGVRTRIRTQCVRLAYNASRSSNSRAPSRFLYRHGLSVGARRAACVAPAAPPPPVPAPAPVVLRNRKSRKTGLRLSCVTSMHACVCVCVCVCVCACVRPW
jgi:hypothetical protein